MKYNGLVKWLSEGLFIFINLTPFIPLSFKGEGEGLVLKGQSPFNLPLINTLIQRKVSPLEGRSPSLKSYPPLLKRKVKERRSLSYISSPSPY